MPFTREELAQVIRYALSNWVALTRYRDEGRLERIGWTVKATSDPEAICPVPAVHMRVRVR